MYLRHVGFISTATALLLVGCSSATGPAPAAKSNQALSVTVISRQPEASLMRGMTAVEVRRIMGEPDKIEPAPAQAGKAETWIYHRITHGPSKQIEIPGKDIVVPRPGANGATIMVTIPGKPTHKKTHLKMDETIQLLMVDDRYLTSRYSVLREQVTE